MLCARLGAGFPSAIFPMKKQRGIIKKRRFLKNGVPESKTFKRIARNVQKKATSFFDRLGFFKVGLLAGFIFFSFLGILVAGMTPDLPDANAFQDRFLSQSTKLYDRTGSVLLYSTNGAERRTVIPFEEIPDAVKFATLAAEDVDFYNHSGYDVKAIGRAVFHNLFYFRSSSLQGGSTITQQLVKNSLLGPERTIGRKLRELVLAVRLEKKYDKDEIFGFYLNQIPYGSGAYGIEAASQTFFAKSAKDLSLEEASLLAALPQAPSYYSPYGNHTEELKGRQEYILQRMAEAGYLAKEEVESAKEKPLKFADKPKSSIRAPHFVFFVLETLEKKYGSEVVEKGGLYVITSLDWRAQEIGEKVIKEGGRANFQWRAGNASLVAEDAGTGEIIAMVGSRGDLTDEPQPAGCTPGRNCTFEPYVNATLSPRQPGSAFKPFVYVTAFKKGYTPETVLFDVPTEFSPNHPACPAIVDFSNTNPICYHPRNYDGTFRGPVTIRQALAQSLNVPSVKLLYLTGISNALQTAKDFGITTLKDESDYGLSLVLGGGAVRLVELVHAYSVFAEDGIFRPQVAILKVEDSSSRVLEEIRPNQKRVIDSQYARLINDILSDDQARVPAYRPGGFLTLPGRDVAAKTGTSQDFRDAWTVGYTPSIVAGVWVGNNNNQPMVEGGAGVAAAGPLWNSFMRQYLADSPKEDFIAPDPVPASKPVLRGKYIVDTGRGPEIHTILYWLAKDDPAGPSPSSPASDPQFANWEAAVTTWARSHLEELSPRGEGIKITLLEPRPDDKISEEGFRISARVEPGGKDLYRITFFFNQKEIVAFDPSENNIYSVHFAPGALSEENEIRIEAETLTGEKEDTSYRIFFKS